MHRLSRRLFLAALAAMAVVTTSPSWAADKLKVVTTFTVLGDMLKNIGGEHIALTTLVGPDGDAHVYEPTPADARALAQADLVVVNGLGFEGWIDRLVKASGYKRQVIVASDGISALKAEEDHGHDHEQAHAEIATMTSSIPMRGRIWPTVAAMSPISLARSRPLIRPMRTTTVVGPTLTVTRWRHWIAIFAVGSMLFLRIDGKSSLRMTHSDISGEPTALISVPRWA